MYAKTAMPTHLLEEISLLNQKFVALLIAAADNSQIHMDADLLKSMRQATGRLPIQLPFLLYRVRRDDEIPAVEIPGCLGRYDERVNELTTITISFLWHLVQDDPLTAQIVSGASHEWCAQLRQQSIAGLASVATGARVQARLIDVPGYWQDLARRRGISTLQRASLGAAGLQLILSRNRRCRVEQSLALPKRESRHG